MIVDQDQLKLLKRNSLFNSVDQSFVDSFIKPKNFFTAKEGTLLYSFEDDSTEMYLISEGEVKIKFCDQRNIEYRFLLDFFGEKEVLDKTKRVSFAIANKDCILYKISSEEINSLISSYDIIRNNLMKVIPEEEMDYLEPGLMQV
jgi:CRP-like cAMP-binding protein